jgi:Family of unknown function (DUF5326)
MGTKGTFAGMPSWLKWAGVIVVALIAFKAVMWILGFVVALLFNVLLFAVVVAGLVFLVRKFMTSSSTSKW